MHAGAVQRPGWLVRHSRAVELPRLRCVRPVPIVVYINACAVVACAVAQELLKDPDRLRSFLTANPQLAVAMAAMTPQMMTGALRG